MRGHVRDSRHPMGGDLPSYLVVGVSLQKIKLQKVKAESKSLLACHLLRCTTIVFIRASKCILTIGF
jgi:hypothetical protein